MKDLFLNFIRKHNGAIYRKNEIHKVRARSHFSERELQSDIVKREAWAHCMMLRRTEPKRRHKLPDSEFSL